MVDPLQGGTPLSVLRRVEKLRAYIKERTKELGIESRHDEEKHWYFVPELNEILSSVSWEHRNIKDPSIRNFEKNESLRFIKANFKQFTDQNIDEQLKLAAEAPILVRDTAGSKGDFIHNCRQLYFQEWIDTGLKPSTTVEAIALARTDIPKELEGDVISGCAAMDQFVKEWNYIPLGVEILVYDKKEKVAGTLDEIGFLEFEDEFILVLADTKSSNQFKDTYTLQVMRYYRMFVALFHMRPKKIVIVKVDKNNRTYKLEWFTPEQIKHGLKANHYLHKFNYHWEAIRDIRTVKPRVI